MGPLRPRTINHQMEPSQAAQQRPLRVALVGLGTVGKAVAATLLDPEWRAAVSARGLVPPELSPSASAIRAARGASSCPPG